MRHATNATTLVGHHASISSASNISFVHINLETLSVALSISGLTLIVGLVCNFCVILTILRTPSLRTSSINRAVLSLCVADLITVLADIPITAAILVGNHYFYLVSAFVESVAHNLKNSQLQVSLKSMEILAPLNCSSPNFFFFFFNIISQTLVFDPGTRLLES